MGAATARHLHVGVFHSAQRVDHRLEVVLAIRELDEGAPAVGGDLGVVQDKQTFEFFAELLAEHPFQFLQQRHLPCRVW